MTGAIWFPISNRGHPSERPSPSDIRILQVANWLAGCLEEEVIVIDPPGVPQPNVQSHLAFQHGERTWAQQDATVFTRLRRVLVESPNARLVDYQCAQSCIEVIDDQCDLFGGSQSGEETKLVIVTLYLAPISMNGRDERLGLLNGEGIDDRPISPANLGAFKAQCGIVPLWTIAIAKAECAPQHADRIVICLFATCDVIRDADEPRESNREESLSADLRPPESVEYSSIGGESDRREVIPRHSRIAVGEERVKDLVTSSRRALIGNLC